MKNIFYFKLLNAIGGIETFFYHLARKYKDWDITIYYSEADFNQVKRLSKYVRVKKYRGEHIVCDKAFFNFNLDIIENVEAKEYIQIAHGDYKSMGILPNQHPKLQRYIGVSQLVCDTYSEIIGKPVELSYNPYIKTTPRKVLNLISATRLTSEKGKDRIVRLAQMFEEADIPYVWTIFTDDTDAIQNDNIVYRKPRLDIIDYIANADYLVQLSDNEGYCYSVIEALSVGTPVIVTKCPVFEELGVNEKNGFTLDFGLENVPLQAIYKGLKKFEYTPKEDRYNEILAPGKSHYQADCKKRVRIRAIKPYFDMLESRFVEYGEEYEVALPRGQYIVDNECAEFVE